MYNVSRMITQLLKQEVEFVTSSKNIYLVMPIAKSRSPSKKIFLYSSRGPTPPLTASLQ